MRAAEAFEWEWIVVDDHSRDDTFDVIARLAASDPRVRGLRLSRNSGSHLAITCGLQQACGDAAVILVADLQDSPELLTDLVARWRAGAQVVWAVRRQQPGEAAHAGFAKVYYWVLRNAVGMRDMPATGTDFFLADRVALDAFLAAADRHVSVFALMMWLGFRREFVYYDKQPRTRGTSGWTLRRKIELVINSIVGFADFPIWWCVYGGLLLVAAAVLVALLGIVAPGPGWAWALGALLLGLSGVQLAAFGLVGQYVSRALDEARGRPAFAIEASTTPAARTAPTAVR